MKIKNIALAILFVSIVFSGCKKIEDALDVTFDSTFKTDLNIDVPPASREVNGDFSATATIDPTADATFNQYLDKIKKIEVTNVVGKITNISTTEIHLTSLTITIATAGNTTSWTFQNITLVDGYMLALDNSAGQLSVIDNILMEKKAFTVSAVGSTEEDDVDYTIEVAITAKVTANPLN
jgi:PBP1b-binding outer membrane lipoprotein LpoB